MSDAKTSRLKPTANTIYEGGTADNAHKLVLPHNTTANLALILPVEMGSLAYDTTLNEVVFNNGSGFAPVSAGSGANQSLNNLSSTAVNADIVPAVDNSIKLGSATLGYLDVYTNLVSSTNTSNLSVRSPDVAASLSAPAINIIGGDYNGSNVLRRGGQINIAGGSGTQKGGTVNVNGGAGTLGGTLFLSGGSGTIGAGSVQMTGGATTSGNTGDIELFTSIPTDNISNSGEIRLQTGQVANGTNGNIILAIGPVSGAGTRGKIQFTDGSEGTSGYVWTSTDTAGSGTWMSAASSGANTTLSNLTNPTAINQNLLPASNNLYNIGSISGSGLGWSNVFASNFSNQTVGQPTNLHSLSSGSAAGATGDVVIKSGDNSTPSSGHDSGNVFLQSGDTTDSDSGDVNISSGSAVAGTAGDINLTVGSGSTPGNINLNAVNGAISLISGPGGETYLDNVAVSAYIRSFPSNTALLGLPNNYFPTGWIGQLNTQNSGVDNLSIDVLNGFLYDFQNPSFKSMDYKHRQLLANDGSTVMADWSSASSGIDFNGHALVNAAAESGNTAGRPATPIVGQMYFDTTLTRPIWYSGSNWILADGTVV